MANVPQNEWAEIRDKVRALWYQMQGPNEQGWELWDGSKEKDTLIDIGRRIQSKTGSRLPLTNRPAGDTDDMLGHILSHRAETRVLTGELRKAAEKWDNYIASKS